MHAKIGPLTGEGVRAPDGFSANPTPVMRGDTVWAVVLGEFDVPFIVRLHIENAGNTNPT